MSGRVPSGRALTVPVEPASSLAPSGFDPSRGVQVTLSPELIERVMRAADLAEITNSYGHALGGGGKGDRIAGWYYQNDAARKADVLPAHCAGAALDVILALRAMLRDSDGNPKGGDGTAPSHSDDSADPKGIAQ